MLVEVAMALLLAGGTSTPRPCLNLVHQPQLALAGPLALRQFPGAPNFTSIKAGDADEATFILTQPRSICITDGDDGFGDPAQAIRKVHIFATDPRTYGVLANAIGRRIKVRGQAFPAETGHHHASLVLKVDAIDAIE